MSAFFSYHEVMEQKILPGLTLIELLVVMSIIAVLITLGVAGLINFRQTVELQLAQDEVQSTIKSTRTLAENNVLPISSSDFNPNLLYGYNLNFDSDDIIRSICSRPDNGAWTCGDASRSIKSTQLSNIELKINASKGCSQIIFENLTGDIKVQTPTSGIAFLDEECELDIKHSQEDVAYFRLVVDGKNNTFRTINIVQDY